MSTRLTVDMDKPISLEFGNESLVTALTESKNGLTYSGFDLSAGLGLWTQACQYLLLTAEMSFLCLNTVEKIR